MKKLMVLPLALVIAFPLPSYAVFGVGDIVYDPANYGAQITTRVETLAKFAEQIKGIQDQILNQMKQIEEAKRLVNIQNEVRAQIGDWQGVFDRAKMMQLSLRDLTETKFDTRVENLLTLDYGQPGIRRTNTTGRDTLVATNAFNVSVTLPAPISNRLISSEKAYENVYNVYKNTEEPIAELRRELGQTYEEMNRPGLTQANYSKLSTKAQSLNSRIAQLESSRQQATNALTAQQIANQNQRDKEAEAQKQVQQSNHETFTRAVGNTSYGQFKWR